MNGMARELTIGLLCALVVACGEGNPDTNMPVEKQLTPHQQANKDDAPWAEELRQMSLVSKRQAAEENAGLLQKLEASFTRNKEDLSHHAALKRQIEACRRAIGVGKGLNDALLSAFSFEEIKTTGALLRATILDIEECVAAMAVNPFLSSDPRKLRVAEIDRQLAAMPTSALRTLEKQAISQLDPLALLMVGRAYLSGHGLPQDQDQGFRLLQQAAEFGFAPAEVSMAEIYRAGIGVEKDDSEANRWLGLASERDSVDADMLLGKAFLSGIGAVRDEERGLKFLTKAANSGDAEAQSRVAKCHDLGQGTNRDPARAFEWYLKAAESGEASAMAEVGERFQKGIGTTKSSKKALRWLGQARAKGASVNPASLLSTVRESKPKEFERAKRLLTLID